MRKREITPLSEDFLKAFDKRMDVVEEVAEPVQIEEAADLKNDPSHSKNPFKYTKKPTNKKEAQGNVNYWHYVGMASNKEIEDMGEVPANYKSYAKSMMQDAQRELKKFNEEVEVSEACATKKEELDPVGKEDDDVDNDGDTDSSDKYLAKRRAAIGKAIKSDVKESVDLEEANAAKIIADLKAGDSIDVIVQKHLNKKTTKDEILKVIRDYNWKNRKSGGK